MASDAETAPTGGPENTKDGASWKSNYDATVSSIWSTVRQAATDGNADVDAAVRRAKKTIEQMEVELVTRYVGALREDGPKHVAAVSAYRHDFAERLRVHWGEALDLYTGVVEVADGLARDVFMRSRIPKTRQLDPLMGVMAALMGQALRGAREVHALLAAGFPFGALAASRTLYETAVRATILADHARLPGQEDLVRRYVQHGNIGWLKHAEVYARDAAELGLPPLADEFLKRLKVEVEALSASHPKEYRDPYGWAYGLPGITNTRDFRQLEALAQTTHRRGYYMWTSHLVHADSRALSLSRVERGGSQATISNATNNELAEPAAQAMWALSVVTEAVVTEAVVRAPVDISPADTLVVRALLRLIEEANTSFVEAEERVDAAEVDLQAERAAEGKRMTPWGVEDAVVGVSNVDD